MFSDWKKCIFTAHSLRGDRGMKWTIFPWVPLEHNYFELYSAIASQVLGLDLLTCFSFSFINLIYLSPYGCAFTRVFISVRRGHLFLSVFISHEHIHYFLWKMSMLKSIVFSLRYLFAFVKAKLNRKPLLFQLWLVAIRA